MSPLETVPLRLAGSALPHDGIDPALLIELRPGCRVTSDAWSELFAEGRLRTRAHAVAIRQRVDSGALSHTTAGAFHRLALYRVRSDRIEMITPGRCPRRNAPDVVRHHTALPDADVVVIDGRRVTSLERTVFDLIRTVTLEAAVVAADAALRQVAWNDADNTYDADAAGDFVGRIEGRIARSARARGVRQARFVLGFADGRAQLPGESISRLWMWQLRLPTPELQRRVELPGGRYALLDFAWPALGRWAEFDGRVKYTDAHMRDGRTEDEVMGDQQERERQVRAATGWSCDRWGFDRLVTLSGFAAHLRTLGFDAG